MSDASSNQIDVRKRCVVILGKCGAGKSTVANVLVDCYPLTEKDPRFDISEKVLAGVTREVKQGRTDFCRNSIKYETTVIDTVGLFDTNARGNDTILDEIEQYFNDHDTGVNLILFVFKKGRFTREEIEVFSFIRRKFVNEICPISALVVTGCESDTTKARKDFIEELQSDDNSKEIASQMQKGIYTVGFPPLKSMLPVLQEAHKQTMQKDREILHNLIIECETEYLTKKMFKEKIKADVKHGWLKGLCTIL